METESSSDKGHGNSATWKKHSLKPANRNEQSENNESGRSESVMNKKKKNK